MTIHDVFGDQLQPEPSIALQPVQIPVRKRAGPMPRLQYVIEFVGPRSVSAGTAANLLSTDWFAALGEPKAFAMSASDVEWRPLTDGTAGSYDSLCIAWDLISERGQLSKATAAHLLTTAEHFSQQIQRRAMPMPVPEDVPKAISQLRQAQANFDAGVSLVVLPNSRRVSEFELWIWCAHLGLKPNLVEGTFDWIVPASPLPLFSISPLGDVESFSLEGAQRGDQHEGVLLGFSLPRSPEPTLALEGMLRSAALLAEKMSGTVFDENDRPVTDGTKKTIRQQLAAAIEGMMRFGIPPGSPEALSLFVA